MGAAERRKGARAQTEAAKVVSDVLGIACRNGAANGVRSGDDIVTPTLPVRWEVKRTERPRLAEYVRQVTADAGALPRVILWRGNRSPWVAIVPLSDLPTLAESITRAREGPP